MTPFIGIPAVVAALIAALTGPIHSLADVAEREALRRAVTTHATRTITNADLPRVESVEPATNPALPALTSTPPEPTVAAAEPTPQVATSVAGPESTEAWWHQRMDEAREALERDRLLVDALQSRINALTTDFTNRDDPAPKARLAQERQRTIDELERQKLLVVKDQQLIGDIQEDARKRGIPPGWIR